jgi:hypothetical protein
VAIGGVGANYNKANRAIADIALLSHYDLVVKKEIAKCLAGITS